MATTAPFEFTFNVKNFSDKVLLLELEDKPDGLEDLQLDEEQPQAKRNACNRKRRRKAGAESEIPVPEDIISKPTLSEKTGSDGVVRKELYVSSAILAGKSAYFLKLFSNGMRESEEKELVIRINVKEEDAVVDAVRFLYCGQLTTRAAADLIRLVLVADRFEIPTCIQAACDALGELLLQDTSSSPWKVVRLLAALPDSVRTLAAVSEFLTKAQKAMSEYYKDFQALAAAPNGLSELSVSGLQMVLEGDDLEIESEAVLFEAVRAWVRARFEGAEERRYAMAQLAPSIRFPCIPPEKLQAYSEFEEMGSEECQKLYTEALLFRALPRRVRNEMAARARDHRRFVWRGTCLAVEGVLGGVPWCDKEEIFYVRVRENSLFGEGKTAIFTEEFSFKGNPYQVEFRQTAEPNGKTIGAYLHVNGKVVQAQLPVVTFRCYYNGAHGQEGNEAYSCDMVCQPAPASGVSKTLHHYGSTNIMQPLRWVHTANNPGYYGYQVFKGPHRVATFRISLKSV